MRLVVTVCYCLDAASSHSWGVFALVGFVRFLSTAARLVAGHMCQFLVIFGLLNTMRTAGSHRAWQGVLHYNGKWEWEFNLIQITFVEEPKLVDMCWSCCCVLCEFGTYVRRLFARRPRGFGQRCVQRPASPQHTCVHITFAPLLYPKHFLSSIAFRQ